MTFYRFCLSCLVGAATAWIALSAEGKQTMGEHADGSALVPSNQTITPMGHIELIRGSRVKDIELSPDGKVLAVMTNDHLFFYTPEGKELRNVKMSSGPLGLAWTPDSRTLFASGDKGQVFHIAELGPGKWGPLSSFVVDNLHDQPTGDRIAESHEIDGELRPDPDSKFLLKRFARATKTTGDPQVTGLAVAPDGKRLYIALSKRNSITVVDTATETVVAVVPVGVAPFRIVVAPDSRTIFVANRGGGHPTKNERSIGYSAGTAVRVDPKTDAALRGSISFIDTETFATTEIDEGRQPAGLLLSRDGKTLYVANSDEDTITSVDVASHRISQSLSLEPAQDPGLGQLPTDVASSQDGRTLYVTCGGGNAIAVVSAGTNMELKGFLPTAWFPVAIVERNGKLFVGNSKGIGARLHGAKGIFPIPGQATLQTDGDFHVNGSVSMLQFIDEKEGADLAKCSKQVAANNHWNPLELGPRPDRSPVPVPERPGEPSVFEHVIYIIKENHTYDFDLGDLPQGNGDKRLCAFGEKITPNEHALSRDFVLLDNAYTSGTNSADGHQWTDSGIANAYIEQNYNSYARSYPFNGTDPLAFSPNGFLWNAVRHAGKAVRVYGEFVDKAEITLNDKPVRPTWTQLWDDYRAATNKYCISSGTTNAALRPCLSTHFIGFPLTVSDQWRADQFLSDFKTFEDENSLPALCMLLLPANHTSGTAPGMPTPRAGVADNDLALGRVVDRISHSRFWKNTLILVVEDDSLYALDHVDGHRMIAFCVSPYTKRGAVVSDIYNHTSFVRTIDLVLGLPALTRFDRTATPLTDCFVDKPDFRPYTCLKNGVPLDELNPPLSALHGETRALAKASSRLNWSAPDRADPHIVARAVWHSMRPRDAFPVRYFHPATGDDDDGD